jgi:dihydrofolate reductase
MSKIYTSATMSLDGYIAGPGESGFDRLFRWHESGDVPIPLFDWTMHLSEPSAMHWRDMMATTGAGVIGRRLFDLTGGWGGRTPGGHPCFVVTHSVPEGWKDRETEVPFTFVTEGGVARAIELAKAAADGRNVSVSGGNLAGQALNAGLLDEFWFDLVPVLLGDGVRMVDKLQDLPVSLEGPITLIQGNGVTHLRYRIAH